MYIEPSRNGKSILKVINESKGFLDKDGKLIISDFIAINEVDELLNLIS